MLGLSPTLTQVKQVTVAAGHRGPGRGREELFEARVVVTMAGVDFVKVSLCPAG